MSSRAGARPVGADADPPSRGALRQLARMHGGAGKAALGAPPLADRPGEIGLDRGRGLVDVMAVEAQPRFEPQRIARAEADRHYLGLGQQPARESLGLARRQRNLEAILAGIPGAGDEAGLPPIAASAAVMKGAPDPLDKARQNDRRRRPLQRQQRAIGERLDRRPPASRSRRCAKSASLRAALTTRKSPSSSRVAIRSSRMPPASFRSSV